MPPLVFNVGAGDITSLRNVAQRCYITLELDMSAIWPRLARSLLDVASPMWCLTVVVGHLLFLPGARRMVFLDIYWN